MTAAGVILAGGRGERLGGVDKGRLTFGGQRLVDRVSTRLNHCDPLLIAIGRRQPGAVYAVPGTIELADPDSDYAGPLAGFAAAVAALLRLPDPPPALICVAVDTPLLPADYAERLLAALDDAPAVIAASGGQPYPPNSAWRLAAISGLPAEIADGTAPHSLRRLGAAIGAIELHWPSLGGHDPFASINTPDDLEALKRRASDLTS